MVLVNVMTRFKKKRDLRPSDPDGILAVLQVSRRLLGERKDKSLYAVLDEALELAAPADPAKAWWAAHRRVARSMPPGMSVDDYLRSGSSTHESLMEVLSNAIRAQGLVNLQAAKGKQPNMGRRGVL